jgi:hypothetical protein
MAVLGMTELAAGGGGGRGEAAAPPHRCETAVLAAAAGPTGFAAQLQGLGLSLQHRQTQQLLNRLHEHRTAAAVGMRTHVVQPLQAAGFITVCARWPVALTCLRCMRTCSGVCARAPPRLLLLLSRVQHSTTITTSLPPSPPLPRLLLFLILAVCAVLLCTSLQPSGRSPTVAGVVAAASILMAAAVHRGMQRVAAQAEERAIAQVQLQVKAEALAAQRAVSLRA